MSDLELANIAFNEGNYVRSVELYRKVSLQSPELRASAEFNLEIALMRLKEPESGQKPPSGLDVAKEANLRVDRRESVRELAVSESLYTMRSTRAEVSDDLTIIVPIFNAIDDLRVCLQKLQLWTPEWVQVLLIDDKSTDPEVSRFLSSVSSNPRFRVLSNESNIGFTRTVNKGIEVAGQDDVILLNSDARVTPRWVEGLRNALSVDASIATVTPMSDRAGAFSAPLMGNENEIPLGVAEDDFAVAFRRHSDGLYPEVPTGNGFCLYIRRKCIDQIGPLDEVGFPRGYGEENDFCMRALRAGWRHVIDDRTYVFHDRNKSFQGEKSQLIAAGRALVDERYPEYKKSTRVFADSPSINRARERAAEAMSFVETGDAVLPRVLYVINSWTGGTPQTNSDLMLSLSNGIEPWLLRSDASEVSLYRVRARDDYELVYSARFRDPIGPLFHTSAEYDQVVFDWLLEFDFSLVHIRHIGLHSLSLPALARASGARVVMSFHDFYAVCPTVKLTDENNVFCGGTCTATSGDCRIDLWKDKKALPWLKNSWVHRWREIFQAQVLDHCDAFVTTHDSVRETYYKHFRFDSPFAVIPHGRDFSQFYRLAAPYSHGEVLRVLVPGNIGIPKGREVIRAIAALDGGRTVHFHILGRASISNGPGITVHGEYRREDFAAHVSRIKPHVGAVLSMWNETWCHTLTELWAVGLPAVVTDFPTVGGRVKTTGAGWVLSSLDPQGILSELQGIAGRREELERAVSSTLVAQEGIEQRGSVSQMGDMYREVYRSVGVTVRDKAS